MLEGFAEGYAVGKVGVKVVGGLKNISNPLEGTTLSKKVLEQMEKGDFHSFPTTIDDLAGYGKATKFKGGDGITRVKVELQGSWKGKNGTYEWIIEPDNTISHRVFKVEKK